MSFPLKLWYRLHNDNRKFHYAKFSFSKTFRRHKRRRTLMKVYFTLEFGYCPLVWMNHSRSLNNRINTLHEGALRLVYNDFTSSFTELLKKYNSVTIHQKNLQKLAIEMFKVKHNLAPEIMPGVFRLKNRSFNTRHISEFQCKYVKTVIYGSQTLPSLGPQI